MKAYFINSLADISSDTWDSLWQAAHSPNYPFTKYAFLSALERSHCTTAASGWQPHHLLISNEQRIIAALPLYIKTHSYGEYVFDWAWADAYSRCGLDYYPKLITAIPFTPATGPRLGMLPDQDAMVLLPFIVNSVKAEVQRLGASSWHFLFPETIEHQQLASLGLTSRLGCQFHWFNHGFTSFEHFLETFNSRKRKSVHRERRLVVEQGITLKRLCSTEITNHHWQQFFLFYQATYVKRSGNTGYLNGDFFNMLAQHSEQVMMVVAERDHTVVAAALYFFDSDTLYGRYWGTLDDIPALHFEACYYQGIEFAIERGLKKFDPGAQGEHKIQRGFTPTLTYSNHWLADSRLGNAVDDFLEREAPAIKAYQDDCSRYLPFK